MWKTNLEGSGYLPVTLVIRDDIIYAATLGFVFALSIKTGVVIWKNSNEGQGWEGISLAFLPDENISFDW